MPARAESSAPPIEMRAGSIRTESLKWTPVKRPSGVEQTAAREPTRAAGQPRLAQRATFPSQPAPKAELDVLQAPGSLPADGPEGLNFNPNRRVAPPAEAPYTPPVPRGVLPPTDKLPPIPRQPNMSSEGDFRCPTPQDKDFFKKIDELSTDITAKEGEFPKECSVAIEPYQPRCWTPSTFTWQASALCSRPLYFQQTQLERYGHSAGPVLQPVISAAQFFATIPALPYAMGLQPPCEYVYSLGYYRPGDCAPYILDPIPFSLRGALFEAGAVTGVGLMLP